MTDELVHLMYVRCSQPPWMIGWFADILVGVYGDSRATEMAGELLYLRFREDDARALPEPLADAWRGWREYSFYKEDAALEDFIAFQIDQHRVR